MKHLLLISAIAVTLAACQSSSTKTLQRVAKGDVHLGGTLRISEPILPDGLAPEYLTNIVAQRIGNQLYVGLLRLNPNTLLPVPAIAEKVDLDTSRLTYVFHLRQGVLFHPEECFGNASRELTAHDVVFSFHRLCRPESMAFASTFKGRVAGADVYHAGGIESITGIVILDDYTLSITLTKPDESFLFVLAQPSAGIISHKAWEDCGQLALGAGPFYPQEEEGKLILLRNPDYFISDEFGNQLPYLDSIAITIIPLKETALEEVLVGGLDLVTGVYLDPVRTLMEKHSSAFTGTGARLVMQRNDESAVYEIYAIHTSKLLGFKENFLGHRDFSVAQLKH